MKMLLKLPVAGLFLLGAVVSALAAARVLAPLLTDWPSRWPLLLALVLGLALGTWRGAAGFYRTLEHELTHVIFAVLCFQRPRHMVVTDRRGGEAGYTGDGNFVISLAPYFFPLTAVVLMLVAWISAEAWRTWVALVMVVAIGYHGSVVCAEIRCGQSDLKQHGRPFSAAVIAGLIVPILSWLLAYAVFGARGFPAYGRAWLESSQVVLAWLRAHAG